MLKSLGMNSLDELINRAVPDSIRMSGELDLPGSRSETEVLNELRSMANRNQVAKSMIGMGYHSTILPGVIQRNLLENPGLVQFIHRCAGYLLFVFSIVVLLRGRRSAHGATRRAFVAAFIALCAQVGLGIYTVMTGAPWQVAIVHQFLAVVTFVLIIRARFLSRYPIVPSIREG